MAAASNESQGLKIAVAAFVSLTVILAVTSYFLYSAYDKAEVQRGAAVDQKNQAVKVQNELLTQRDELRKLVGPKTDEPEAYNAEIKAEQKKADEKIVAIAAKAEAVVAKAQAAGAQGPELQEAKDAVKRLVQEYQGEVNKNYISSINRLADIFENMAVEMTALSMNYVTTRRSLEQANQINETAITAQTDATKKAQDETRIENENHTKGRAELLKKVDEYQTEIAKQATEIANLTAKLAKLDEDSKRTLGQRLSQITELKDTLAKDETVLDVAGGKITAVDYSRSEARTNITKGMGAHPQMVFSVFDSNSPGIPSAKPKAKVELIWVGDRYSMARIEKTNSAIEPIRAGDLLYSPAWSPNKPTRFALIGKIDVNRDGRDDRQDLIRMIEASGGLVDYDLPPPEAGKEKGRITGLEQYYVIDDQMAIRVDSLRGKENTPEYLQFLTKRSDAIKLARSEGLKPMRKERLLTWLGYDFAAPVRGTSEGVDTSNLKLLLRAKQGGQTKGAAPAPAAGENATPKDEEKKEKPGKEEMEKEEK